MTISNGNGAIPVCEVWEKEVLARHRWGQHGDIATEEHTRLKRLWQAIQPLDESAKAVMAQIIALEICNWNLEESILALCNAIGQKEPAKLGIGHMTSMSQGRWRKVWAYYLTCQDWLTSGQGSGYGVLLSLCDPEAGIQNHILSLLGEKNELKELYVERFCLCLGLWLSGSFSHERTQTKAHCAAVLAVEEKIKKRDPQGQIVGAFKFEGDGRLNPCHHKLFRRYDIILSSIGAGKWCAVMPTRGTDGFERAATLEKFLLPIELWISGRSKVKEYKEEELLEKIHTLLGKPDHAKLFLASLLVSLLRSQQLAARRRAESRKRKS